MYRATSFYHSLCCRCFTIIIKQGLFLLGDMAILNMNITILQIFLFDEFLPVFLVTGYFIEIMADLGGQSQYKNCSPVMYNPQYSTRSFSLLTFLIGGIGVDQILFRCGEMFKVLGTSGASEFSKFHDIKFTNL